MALLEVKDIDVFYGDVQVVYGMSLRVEEGEVVSIVDGYTGLVLTALARGRPDEASDHIRGLDDRLLERGMLVGVADEVKKQLREYAEAGVQRIMLQWLDLDDLDGLRSLAKVVL